MSSAKGRLFSFGLNELDITTQNNATQKDVHILLNVLFELVFLPI